jgi:hypothetical protein
MRLTVFFFFSFVRSRNHVTYLMATSQPDNNDQQSSYLIAAAIAAAATATKINSANETTTLCDIKILCKQRKKVYDVNKKKTHFDLRHLYF